MARTRASGTPRAMTGHDIDVVMIAQFTQAGQLASQAGFQVVEVHAAHGFLLSQFMFASSYQRTNEFGGSADKRVELILRIIRSIRKEVPPSFCVGVKINSADCNDETGFNNMLRQIDLIQKEEIDYVHLSGGSFEDPQVCHHLDTQHRKKSDILMLVVQMQGQCRAQRFHARQKSNCWCWHCIYELLNGASNSATNHLLLWSGTACG
ncbi:hypothetical protein S40288_09606 [Stachybotrys chartarum IBT 40288]|nr:hypothetical protein S40288_09606 [Stachybotrys chartarum IBT 40288]